MSKTIDATCVGGVVTAEGVPVPGTEILAQGVGASEGILILDVDNRYYLPKTSTDLDATLAQVIAALDAAISGLGSASAGFSALAPVADPIAGPIAVASAVAGLAAAATALSSAKAVLVTLKGALK